jgi:PAS domain S-box-containing protein
MIQKIKALFSAPVFEGDLEKTLKARELTNILNVLLSGTVIFTALMPVFAGRLPPRWYFVLPLYLICLGGHWLMRRGQVQISGWFLVLGLWLAVTSAEITQGGVKSSIFVGNLVVILGAAILDGFGHALGYFALTFFKGLLLILAEEYGYLPPPMEFVESSRLILLTQLFIAAMVVAFLRMATMGMRLSLAHAHRELVERRLMEKSLLESEQRYRLLYETEQKQAQELALEGQVRTAMAQELDLPFLLRNIVESIADSYGYTLVSVYLLEGNTLYLQHQVGYAKTIPKITLGKGVISRSVLSREPVLLEDVRTDPQFLGAIENLVSEICIPLFDEGRVVGALNVESTQDTKLTESDLKLLTGLGEHVSLAIRQARLYSGLQRQNRILSALEEATLVLMRRLDLTEVLGTIVSQAARIMDTPHGYLYLVQTDEHSMQMTVGTGVFADSMGKHLKPQEGLAGKVWMSGQPLNIPLYHTWTGRSPQYSDIEFHAVVGVPLTSQAHVVGVTGLAYVEPGRIFSDEDIELLSHFAKLASIALENARLYSLAQQELVERSRAEEALKQAETLYRTLVEQTSIVVYRDAPDGSGTPLYISPQIETLLGYSVEEWLSDPSFWQRVIHPEDLPRVLESLGHCLSAEGKSSIEYRMRRKNGAWCWVRDETLTVKDADGNAQFVHGVFMDISDRKQAEEILRMFQYSVEQSMDAIFWMVRDGGFTYVNEKACSSLGYTREELLGLHLWDIDPIYPRELWDSNWDGYQPEHRGGGEHVETLHRRKNGSTFPVEVFSKHLWFGDRELHVAVVRDISEHKQAQATLRESEERYRTLAEAAQDMIFIISGNGTIEYVNESAAQKFTLLPEELVGRSMAELFPEDVAGRQWKNVQMVFNTGKPVYIENATMFGV